MKPIGPRPGILHGLSKIHPENRNGIPPFLPILSGIDITTYKLATFLLQCLTPSRANEFTAIDSFHSTETIFQQDSNLHIDNLDVDSLFTNILLEETIDVSIDNLQNDNKYTPTSQSIIFVICLTQPPKNPYLRLKKGIINKQMVQLWDLRFGSKWLRNCANDFKPVFYRHYIYGVFVPFSSPAYADKFREYLPSKHPNINFFIEKKKDGCLPQMLKFFVKTRNLQLTSTEKRPSVGLIPT